MTRPLVLVLDDDAAVRELLVLWLHTAGYDAVDFGDSALALAWIAEHRPAVLVLDLRMQPLSGVELLGRLRTAGLTTPAVLISAYVDAAHPELVQARTLGTVATLAKDGLTAAELSVAVELALHGGAGT